MVSKENEQKHNWIANAATKEKSIISLPKQPF